MTASDVVSPGEGPRRSAPASKPKCGRTGCWTFVVDCVTSAATGASTHVPTPAAPTGQRSPTNVRPYSRPTRGVGLPRDETKQSGGEPHLADRIAKAFRPVLA